MSLPERKARRNDPAAVGQTMHDGRITSAKLPEIKSMPTWCVRGERFCDGHGAALRETVPE